MSTSSAAIYPAIETPSAAAPPVTGDRVFQSTGAVEVFEVKGTDRTPLAQDTLLVTKVQPNIWSKPKLHLKVGTLEWDCFKEVHVMRSTSSSKEATFIFSHPDNLDVFHCVIFAADAPGTEIQRLEDVLQRFTTFHVSQIKKQGPFPGFIQLPKLPFELPPPPQLPPIQLPNFNPQEVADNLRKGSEAAAKAIVQAAQNAGQAITQSAQNAKKGMPACQAPTPVNPELKDNLEKAKQATAASATIVGGVAAGVAAASQQVAHSVADTLATTGAVKKLQPKDDQQAKAVQEVGCAGAEAFNNVRVALEQAAYILWFHARGAAIDVVNHSHGPDAAQATATGLDIVQGVGDVAHAMVNMKTSRVMASAIKEGAHHLKDAQAQGDGPRYPPGFNPALLGNQYHLKPSG